MTRRLAIAGAAALAAFVVWVLIMAGARELGWQSDDALIMLLAAVWVPCWLLPRRTRAR